MTGIGREDLLSLIDHKELVTESFKFIESLTVLLCT